MKKAFTSIVTFFKKETVLCIAAVLAVISAFLVPPSKEYIDYIDFRVLALLFCLMLVVSGLQSIGVFDSLAQRLLKKVKNTRQLILLLTALCFLSAMFITNDVALITFVPFTIMILSMAGQEAILIPSVALQTIAANMGSMLTPIGNPQNLYLYSYFELSIGTFLLYMLPLTLVAALLLIFSIYLMKNQPLSTLPESLPDPTPETMIPQVIPKVKLTAYLILFAVCIACVIRVLSWPVMLAILVVAVLFLDIKSFLKADYLLLLTFVCFFVFIGNVKQLPAVTELLRSLIEKRELLMGILSSQLISNVPAAILLSGFTTDARALLYGIDLGGLGTLIASLASVISFKLYGNSKGASKGAYLKTFTIYNLVFLLILTGTAVLLLTFF
ncbi:MAG: SLC13 family permease [Acetatifactor sp.]